MNYLYRN